MLYIRKKEKHVGNKRTACIGDINPVKHLVSLIKNGSKKYKKHWSYVDHCSTVFPLMKDASSEKYVGLDFSQNIAT